MKIALIDNMNNNFFAFSRYLRDCGIESYLYETPYSTGSEHFQPHADTFLIEKHSSWLKKFPVEISHHSWIKFRKKLLQKEFAGFDLIVAAGRACGYLCRAGIIPDVTIPYGSDLYQLPFMRIIPSFSKAGLLSILSFWFSFWQKRALKMTPVLITDPEYPLYFDALQKLGLKAKNWGLPMLYNKENLDTQENRKIWECLEDHDFIVFNHSRQWWKRQVDPELLDFDKFGGAKRNDRLIRAFAAFIKNCRFKKPMMVLFEYGADVDQTKLLIEELGIARYVCWMPKMNRKNIMFGLKKATFSANAFRENIVDIGGVCYEALAVGSLHLNNCQDAISNPAHKFFQSPMLHVLTEEDILGVFRDYESNPEKYLKIKSDAVRWFDDQLGEGLARRYVRLFELLQNKHWKQCPEKIDEIFKF